MEENMKHTRLPFNCGAGEASVNVRTGRVTFMYPDFGMGSGNYAIGVGHVHNPETRYPAGVQSYTGNGWKLNLQQYIIAGDGGNGAAEGEYIYVDDGGLSHKFVPYKSIATDSANAVVYCHDTEGLGLKLRIPGIDADYTVIDEMGADESQANCMNFDAYGRLTGTVSADHPDIEKTYLYEAGKLVEIYDKRKSSRKITLSYDAATGLLDNIKYLSNTDGQKVDQRIHYYYDADANLVRITRTVHGVTETVAYFEYTNLGDLQNPRFALQKAVDGKDFSALELQYSGTVSEDAVYPVEKVLLGCNKVTKKGDQILFDGITQGDRAGWREIAIFL